MGCWQGSSTKSREPTRAKKHKHGQNNNERNIINVEPRNNRRERTDYWYLKVWIKGYTNEALCILLNDFELLFKINIVMMWMNSSGEKMGWWENIKEKVIIILKKLLYILFENNE